MFKRNNRLSKTKDIERVFKQGRSYYNQFLGIKAVANNLAHSRLTVIVSLKVSKQAVQRNRLKRQLRSYLEKALPQFKGHYDLVIICLPTAVQQSFKSLTMAMQDALIKLKLL